MRASLSVCNAVLLLLATNGTSVMAATLHRSDHLRQVQESRLVEPLAESQALASSSASAAGVLVRGIRASDLAKITRAGGLRRRLDRFEEGKAVAIGRKLAEQLAVRAGDSITLVMSSGQAAAVGTSPRLSVYIVDVVLETGTSEYDPPVVFMASEEALKFLGR
jgi:lipoprotein-releasing system permease protein